MKILQITTISNTINAFLIPHIEALIAQGHEVELACRIENPLDNRLSHLKRHDISFQRNPLATDNLQAYFQLKQLFKQTHYDIIHTHTPNASVITRLAAHHQQSYVVYTAHGFHFYQGAPRINWLAYYNIEKLLAHYTDKIVTINTEDYQRASHFKLKKHGSVHQIPGIGTDIEVVHQPELTDTIKQQYQLTPADKVLVFAAELSKGKNQDMLINVMAQLVAEGHSNYRLFLLGNGPNEAAYRQRIQELNLERNIFLTGLVKDVRPYLDLADVAVSSSLREGLPVNVMEALAYGVPVVITKIRGHVDLLQQPNQGLLITNSQEMVQGIKTILNNPQKYHAELPATFTVNSSVQAMQKIYAEMGA
ncbi:glycosyltransferase family 4 protein [Lapidilactobacillus dextrinicus]|nr:glycosyltransferase family 4 protein [Lapidilactobacillus dextrinicus]